MTEASESPTGIVRRFALRTEEAVLAHGDFRGLFAVYEAHVHRWESIPDPLCLIMMRQALGGAALHLSCRPRDQMTAWTINIARPPLNVFVAGNSADSTVVGRVYTEDVSTAGSSRLFVESRRPHGKSNRSMIDVTGYDVLQIFEQYYEQSEQNPARFFEFNETEFVMVLAMPGADPDWLAALDRERVKSILDAGPSPIDTQEFTFRCGCDHDRMVQVVHGMFKEDPTELFQGDANVEVSCPRCGRRWTLDRDEFDELQEDA